MLFLSSIILTFIYLFWYVLMFCLSDLLLVFAASLALLCKFLCEILYFISDFGELWYGAIHTQLMEDFKLKLRFKFQIIIMVITSS